MHTHVCTKYVYVCFCVHTYGCIHPFLFRKMPSQSDSLQPLVDLSPSIRSYITTTLEPSTEYQFQLMASTGDMIHPVSDKVSISTEPIGKHQPMIESLVNKFSTYVYT